MVGEEHRRFLSAALRNWRYAVGIGALPVLLFAQRLGRFYVPHWSYWIVLCLTLYGVFFKTWRDEHRCAQTLQERTLTEAESDLLAKTQTTYASFMNLMRRWPNSPAVLNPFGKNWRPLVGETNIGADSEAVMNWRDELDQFLNAVRRTMGDRAKGLRLLRFADGEESPTALNCLASLLDVQEVLVKPLLKPPS